MKALPSVKNDLRRHTLDNDLLVYDPHDEQIHLLNAPAAKVLDMMLKGFDSDAMIATIEADTPGANGAELLELALDELAAARLFAEAPARISKPTTRREMILRAASVGAAIAVPSILTLAPNKALAQVGTGLSNGTLCNTSSQCLSGCCGGNAVGTCMNNRCNPPANCGTCTPG